MLFEEEFGKEEWFVDGVRGSENVDASELWVWVFTDEFVPGLVGFIIGLKH